ncbi:MAG: phosphatase PAP2 family protein [Bacteroidia bacterium]|nr:phosphatase PAP2 family protein [Bacteroidia bacterium]
MRFFTFFCLWCLSLSSLYAQSGNSPYRLSVKKDLPITLGSVVFSTAGQLFQHSVQPLTATELASLNRLQINRFDRPTSFNWRPGVQKTSDKLLLGAVLLPATLLAFKPIRKDFPEVLIMGVQTLSFTYGLTGFAKASVKRNRPFTYLDAAGNDELFSAQTQNDARFSFFSGHTSMSAASTFFLAKVYSDYYPRSSAKPFVWTGAILVPAVIGFLRVRSGKHFPTDVITGYVVGAAVGILTPHLHKNF